jgi:hypothetical protein
LKRRWLLKQNHTTRLKTWKNFFTRIILFDGIWHMQLI